MKDHNFLRFVKKMLMIDQKHEEKSHYHWYLVDMKYNHFCSLLNVQQRQLDLLLTKYLQSDCNYNVSDEKIHVQG